MLSIEAYMINLDGTAEDIIGFTVARSRSIRK